MKQTTATDIFYDLLLDSISRLRLHACNTFLLSLSSSFIGSVATLPSFSHRWFRTLSSNFAHWRGTISSSKKFDNNRKNAHKKIWHFTMNRQKSIKWRQSLRALISETFPCEWISHYFTSSVRARIFKEVKAPLERNAIRRRERNKIIKLASKKSERENQVESSRPKKNCINK